MKRRVHARPTIYQMGSTPGKSTLLPPLPTKPTKRKPERRLTIIAGPQGVGKTTLARDICGDALPRIEVGTSSSRKAANPTCCAAGSRAGG
jgi:GTPase SAR1 family protein